MKKIIFSTVALIGLSVAAKAEPAVGVAMVCPYTGPGIAICAAAGTALHEFVQMANGKKGFGPNGEIMKVVRIPVGIVDGNVKGATRESGELAKVLRGTIGISIRDIERHGVFGGSNSVFRKPFG